MVKRLLLIANCVLIGSAVYGQVINTFPFTEDFESQPNGPTGCGPSYTFTGTTWQNGDDANPASGGHDVDWTVDENGTGSLNTGPSVDHTLGTGTGHYIYMETSCNNTGYPNIDFHLVSPYMDFTALSAPQFTFWYHTYGTSGGELHVDVDTTVNGTPNWVTDVIPAIPNANIDQWFEGNASLAAFAGFDSVRIRIRGISGTSFGSDLALDDLSVFEPQPVELELTSIDSIPPSACGLGIEDAWITITENGTTGLAVGDTIFATYNDGTNLIQDTIVLTAPLGPGMTYNHMFSQLVDYSTPGTYNITASIFNSADASSGDDTLMHSVTNVPVINTFPYFEDFENGPGGWMEKNTTDGAANGNWEFGTPANAVINSALSGDSAWVTGLSSNYNTNVNAWVESPCFDMTAATGNEQLAMGAWWNAEFSWDGANVTYSTDGGGTWSLLGNFGDPGNWYTDNTISGNPGGSGQGWTGGSGGWVYAKHDIPAAVFTSSDVKFRVNFGSDGSVQDEGFAFDNFAIAPPPSFDAFPDTLSICDTILGEGADPGDQWLAYLWDTGETTQFSTSNATGIHWVEVTGPFGTCARDSFFVDTFFYALPPGLEDDRLICYPEMTTLDAGADTVTAYTYLWSTGETTSSIMTGTPGVYTVTKQDAGGNCVFNDTLTLTVARVDLGPSTMGYCTGAFPTLDAGPGGVTYLWNTNDTTQTVTATGPGAYSVTVVDTNGCLLIDAIDLVESIPAVDLGPDQTICVYNTTTLDAGTHTSYLWSEGTTTQTLLLDGTTLGTGTYNYDVTVTDSIGCTGTDAIVITVDACAGLEDLAELGMTISPNPSEGVFNYTIENYNEISGMEVMDLTGKLVATIEVEGAQGAIDLTNYESGVYILRIQAGDNTTSVRLIKH